MTTNNGWPLVPLGEVLTHYREYIDRPEPRQYPKLSVRLYGKGVVLDTPADGSSLKMQRHQVAKAGQVILSEIWGKKGAIGFVPEEGDGALCTSHFFLFDVCRDRVEPGWLHSVFHANYLADQLDSQAFGTTGYAAVRPKALLAATIPLPPLEEQRRIVARIDRLAAKIDEANLLSRQCDLITDSLLLAAYHKIAEAAPRKPLGEVAPLIRRPAAIDTFSEYPQVSVRSFGRGTFHNPPLQGSEITWQKPYLVHAGDILVSNIKAWEGAIAVAGPDDDGRYGSHRYLTFVPVAGVATARFLCFHLLSSEGLFYVGEASAGSADRNRTLSAKKMLEIPVPVPPFEQQQRFDALFARVTTACAVRTQATAARDAMLPSILDRAFKGAL